MKEPTFRLREVVLGPSLGDRYVIREGLEKGEEIVTYGAFAIDAAAQLAGKPSMMNRKGGKSSTGHDHGSMSGSDDKTAQSSSTKEEEIKPLKWPASEGSHYKTMVESYLALKNNLVNDSKANEQASRLHAALLKIDMGAFSDKGHMKWMEHQKMLKQKAEAINKAEKLGTQRKHFIQLSEHMIDLVKTFKAPKDKLYVQFCPMANDDKGAYWLSEEDQVRNPYYGDMMLKCGEVRDEIDK
jgi:Cu(I)/Ag(I) efflux system membrane fusion protein